MEHRASLEAAFADVENGTLPRVVRVVVNRAWWDALSLEQRDAYRHRSHALGLELSADDRLSRHYVEVQQDAGDSPLSSERRI